MVVPYFVIKSVTSELHFLHYLSYDNIIQKNANTSITFVTMNQDGAFFFFTTVTG